MEPARWSRIEQVFNDALQHPLQERTAFVHDACSDDSDLCHEVSLLLECDQKAGSWPDARVSPPGFEVASAFFEGRRVGAYRIDRQIGEGGMGAVFLASRADDQYEKKVAIKLVRTGMQTAFFAERFRNERQILAALEHPHIARLLDGGVTADALPFLVMEYIEGVPLDAYCDTRDRSITGRLQLFRKICAAVHYAHQHLVIHRDLKPSNILVTEDGEPKLLDFGIAKLIDTGTESSSATGFVMATPQYASPELLDGQPVTTATDVYSLGVILYRILTGCSPYGSLAGLELLSAILKGDIAKPSAVASPAKVSVPGDLDSIVLKALRREPARRYASAELLAEDVRRHIESLPVLAGNESFRYSAAKFVRRNRIAVGASMVVAASLLAATAVSLHQLNVAAHERRVAEQHLDSLRKLTGSVLFEFHDAIQTLPGATQARKLLTQRALEYLNSLDPATAREPSQRAQLVEAYRKIGDVQGNPTNANLGDTAGALSSYAKALAIAREMVRSDPGDNGSRRALALLLQRIADTRAQTGELRPAVEDSRASLAMFLDLAARDNSLESHQQAGTAHIKLADLLGHPAFPNVGDHHAAFDHYQQALLIYNRLTPVDNPVTRRYLGIVHERIGKMLEVQGRKKEALASYQKSFAIREALAVDYPANTNARRDLAIAHEKLGDLLVATGQATRGIERFQQALGIFEALHTLDPSNANATRAVAIEYEKTADTFALAGDPARATSFYAKARSVFQGMVSADTMNARARADLNRVVERSAVSRRQ